ncbi:MAG: sigma-70 family RNA polymerase sigma factor [Flavobacteriia bacterium]|nr:sigma-70 family RNA polymerase sigma factor [Flavobacteriia bacterium]
MQDYSKEQEEILIQAIQLNANQKAFEELMKRHSNLLFQIIHRIVQEREESMDILQNVWIKIWEKRKSFLKDSSFYTWAYRIAKNESLNFLNSARNRKNKVDISFIKGSQQTSISSYTQDEIQNHLFKAMDLLPEKQGLVFQLKYFEEKKYSEIAVLLKLNEGTLKAHYFHAVKKIEDYLKNQLNYFE